ncbi:MAG: hypothetical protein A2Y24_06765 [Clostridiales bacterium GWE2_32_10]|nr:MAG: hypothetical protein A2Y24_06765 [Clostridiales bacterium GWE2_32_10]HBY20996.1 hypothetical protein [Clostridiales bacterium]
MKRQKVKGLNTKGKIFMTLILTMIITTIFDFITITEKINDGDYILTVMIMFAGYVIGTIHIWARKS